VIVFEILLNASALFNHANLALKPGLDRVLRLFLVTPAMHSIHHSTRMVETNSNFGFALSIWDRAFGTYRARAAAGLVIGLDEPMPRGEGLGAVLMMPWRYRGRSQLRHPAAKDAPDP
jgi:sterol desaturase/sphingolipid hydroxylase (fatty acid hydroxylase superfamily)